MNAMWIFPTELSDKTHKEYTRMANNILDISNQPYDDLFTIFRLADSYLRNMDTTLYDEYFNEKDVK